MSSNNLIVIALTGLLLFAYTFFSNNPALLAPEALEYLRIAVLICGGVAIVNLISFLLVEIWLARAQGKSPSALLKLVISPILVYYTMCGLTVGQALGWDATALFATSALVAVVAGLALRSTLSDFLSGIALRLDQPFQLGDRINVRNDGETMAMILSARLSRLPGAPSACAATRGLSPTYRTRSLLNA